MSDDELSLSDIESEAEMIEMSVRDPSVDEVSESSDSEAQRIQVKELSPDFYQKILFQKKCQRCERSVNIASSYRINCGSILNCCMYFFQRI